MANEKTETKKQQKFEFVLDEETMLVKKVPVDGEPVGIVDCLINDIVTLVRPFSLKEKRALILLARDMNSELVAKEKAAKEAKKKVKEVK